MHTKNTENLLNIKISTVVLLCCAFLLVAPTFVAFAATDIETAIVELATSDKRIVRAVCVVAERNCLVALQTKGFTQKSQYDEFVDELTKQITTQFQIDRVYISKSPRVMLLAQKIANADQSQRQKILDDLLNNSRFDLPAIKHLTA